MIMQLGVQLVQMEPVFVWKWTRQKNRCMGLGLEFQEEQRVDSKKLFMKHYRLIVENVTCRDTILRLVRGERLLPQKIRKVKNKKKIGPIKNKGPKKRKLEEVVVEGNREDGI